MSPSFIIHKAQFDVTLCAGREGDALEEGLVSLLRDRLMPVLELVLESFTWPSETVMISKLVVDLGDISVDQAEDLLPKRFEGALQKTLMTHLSGIAARQGASFDRTAGDVGPEADEEASDLELRSGASLFQAALREVLVYGRTGQSLSLVRDRWPDNLSGVRQSFLYYAHDRRVPRHAARYLKRGHLMDSATLISPEHGPFIGAFVVKTLADRMPFKEAAPGSGDADGFERLLWEFTLAYLLVGGRGRFERQQYVSHVISRMAARQNIKVEALLVAFQTVFSRVADAHGLEVRSILGEFAMKLEIKKMDEGNRPKRRDEERADFYASLVRVLEGTGRSTDLERVRRLLKRELTLATELVKRLGRRAEARANMVSCFSSDELETIVSALGPEEAAVCGFVAQSVAHGAEIHRHAPEVTGREVFSDLLWELSLASLLGEKTGRFNFKSYLAHLIAGMAARYNMAYGTLLGAFCRVYETGPGEKEPEIRFFLTELRKDAEKRESRGLEERPSGVVASENGGRAVKNLSDVEGNAPDMTVPMGTDGVAREYTDRIWKRLAGGPLPEGDSLRDLLHALRQENPVLFMRWVRELQGRPDRIRLMVKSLERDDLAGVLYEVLAVLTMAPEESLRQSVKCGLAVAEKGREGGVLNAEVVAGLLRGMPAPGSPENRADGDGDAPGAQLAAWMAILKRGGSDEAAAMVTTLKGQMTGEPVRAAELLLAIYRRFVREGARSQPSLERLARFLDGADSPNLGEQALCAWDIQRALAGNASGLKKVLTGRLRTWNGARRLAGSILENEGVCVLGLLAPSWGKTVMPFLDALMLGIASAGRASNLWKWKRLIWAWTFQLAATRSGMAMALALFLDTLLAWLERHGGRGLVGELLALVSTNIRPETEGALLPVVEAMHRWLHGDRDDDRAMVSAGSETMALTDPGASAVASIDDPAAMAPAFVKSDAWVHASGRQDRDGEEAEEEAVDEACWIENAGLVILSPYLPMLFSRLGYLENGRFIDNTHADRAALLLDFLVHTTKETPEHPMTFNRLFCGTASKGRYLERIVLDESETAMAETMLRAVVAHWAALKNTSPDGLREAFLARQGDLRLKDGAWHLNVVPKAWDVLLDRLPWGMTPIRHPWMKQPLYVNWR